jgi:hypothetical protein
MVSPVPERWAGRKRVSMLLMAKAMTMKVGNPLRKLVLLKLADNASDLGGAGLVINISLTSVK